MKSHFNFFCSALAPHCDFYHLHLISRLLSLHPAFHRTSHREGSSRSLCFRYFPKKNITQSDDAPDRFVLVEERCRRSICELFLKSNLFKMKFFSRSLAVVLEESEKTISSRDRLFLFYVDWDDCGISITFQVLFCLF
jgi:hypothetical protein